MKIVVDGMAETYRQYYAMRLNSSVNIQTGAIFGFLRSMLSYTNQFGKKPCIAWEGGDLYRKEMYPQYKEEPGRNKDRSDVYAQVDIIKEMLSYMGVRQYYMPRREADDVMYSFAKTYCHNDFILIITLDSDLMQTVEENISIFNPRLKRRFNRKDVFDKLGVFPEKVALLKAILGDASDNIKGVKRLLYKVVSACLYNYNTLDEIIEDKLNVGLKVRDKIKINRGLIEFNLKLTKIDNVWNEVIELPSKIDKINLTNLLSKLEFFSYIKEKSTKIDQFLRME